MIVFIKSILKKILLPGLYFGSIFVVLKTIFKEAKWGLILLVFLIPQPNLWHKLMEFPLGKDILDFVFLAVVLGIFVQRKGFEKTQNTRFILFLIVMSYFSLWNSSIRNSLPMPISGANYLLEEWKNYAQMLILYFLALNVAKEEKEQKFLVVLMCIVILIMTIRSHRNFTGGASFSYDKRDPGPFWSVGLGANHYGAFLSYFGAFFLGMSFFIKDKINKYLYMATGILSTTALLFTYSRGAYLAILGAVAFFGLKKKIILVAIVAILLSWQFVLPVSVVDRISMTEDSSGKLEDSASHRVILWQYATNLFYDSPLYGVGYRGFGMNMPEGELTDTHNYYMLMLCEQGIIGLVLFIITLIKAWLSGWHLFRGSENEFYKAIGFGFMGCTIACALANIFGDRWSYFTLGGYFWILWGIIDRSILITKSKIDEDNMLKVNDIVIK